MYQKISGVYLSGPGKVSTWTMKGNYCVLGYRTALQMELTQSFPFMVHMLTLPGPDKYTPDILWHICLGSVIHSCTSSLQEY